MRFHSVGALVPVVTVLLWLSVTCPVASLTQSFDGGPAPVHFAAPVASGGQPPVTAECSPHSGSAFGIGTTEVTCGASDALQQTASCVFGVTVLGPPKLAVTRFLAFGDSLTAGVVSSPAGGGGLNPSSSYVSLLQRDLQARYVTQMLSILNEGVSGEQARHAVSRFDAVLRAHRPDVVLLMEGTNDLDVFGGGTAELAAQAMDSMVARAQRSGLDVLLMTIPPQRHTAAASLVPGFNDRIRAIAARRGVVLVDVFNVVLHGSCSGERAIPCLGADGLHPTADGYSLIAEELARVIVDRHDVEILPAAGQSSGAFRAGTSFSGEVFAPPGGHP